MRGCTSFWAERFSAAVFLILGGLVSASAQQPDPVSEGGPAVMRRLTEQQYRNTIRDIFGDVTFGGKFEPDQRVESLVAVGAGQATVTPAGLEQYDRMAMRIGAQVVDYHHRDQLIPCKPSSAAAPDDFCASEFLAKVGHLLFRRPLSEAELTAYIKVASTGASEVKDFYFGIQLALAGMLEAPQFLFVEEESEPDQGRPNVFRLTPQAVATRLSLLLWSSTPDLRLLQAAENGELGNPNGLTKQVDRMLASSRLESGVRAFFADMLSFDGFDALGKDTQLYPNYSVEVAKQAQEQTLRTIVDLLLVRGGDYRELFTTNRTFLTPLLASVYGVPYKGLWGSPSEWTTFEMPKDMPETGILTQISFLALHSHPGSTSPTLRGRALRELLMCQKVPDPPANVDFSKFDASAKEPKTLRQRLETHVQNPVCAGCHRIMDPIGLALENYDTIGGYRLLDNSNAIDASGTLDGVAYKDAAGLGKVLHDSPKTSSCLVQRIYAYGTGRPMSSSEKDWIKKYLDDAFAADGYRLPQLLRRIVLNPGFYRVQPTDASSQQSKPSAQAEP